MPVPSRTVEARAGRRRSRWSSRLLTNLGFLGVAALVLVAALSGVGGTYALWSDQLTVDAGTLSSGTAELEASWNSEAPDSSRLLPGDTVTRTAQLSNSGDVPLALSFSVSTGAAGFEVSVGAGACTDRPQSSDDAEIVLSAGESIDACIAMTATPELAPGQKTDYTLTIDGKQVQ